MTIEQFAAEVRALAVASGAVADERYWPQASGVACSKTRLTPVDAWKKNSTRRCALSSATNVIVLG